MKITTRKAGKIRLTDPNQQIFFFISAFTFIWPMDLPGLYEPTSHLRVFLQNNLCQTFVLGAFLSSSHVLPTFFVILLFLFPYQLSPGKYKQGSDHGGDRMGVGLCTFVIEIKICRLVFVLASVLSDRSKPYLIYMPCIPIWGLGYLFHFLPGD